MSNVTYFQFYQRPFVYLTSLLISGILLQDVLRCEKWSLVLLVGLFGLIYIILYTTKRSLQVQFSLLLLMMVGAGMMTLNEHRKNPDLRITDRKGVVVDLQEVGVSDSEWKKVIAQACFVVDSATVQVVDEKVLLIIASNELSEGDKLLVSSNFEYIRNKGNPGEFDAKRFWNNQNIYRIGFVGASQFKLLKPSTEQSFFRFFDTIRNSLSGMLEAHFSGENLSVLQALLLGDKSNLSVETKNGFSSAGAMHVLAVSGLHVGIILQILLFIFTRFSRFISKNTATIIAVGCIWMFAGITGFSPSVLRASFMFSIIAIAQVFGRKNDGINGLFFSAFILLLVDPLLLYNLGFQLSYLAMIGIMVFYPSIERLIYVPNKWIKKVWQGTAIGLAAQFLTTPLSLYYFHQFPNYFVLTNVGMMVFAGLVLTLGFAFFSFYWWSVATALTSWLLWAVVLCMLSFIHGIEDLPWAVAYGYQLDSYDVLLAYVGIALLLGWYHVKLIRIALVTSLLVLFAFVQFQRTKNIKSNHMLVLNHNTPTILLRCQEQNVCFYSRSTPEELGFIFSSYTKLYPGDFQFIELQKGFAYSSEGIRLEMKDNGVEIAMNEQHLFLRTSYKGDVPEVDSVIDMPYLATDVNHYSLKEGAFSMKL